MLNVASVAITLIMWSPMPHHLYFPVYFHNGQVVNPSLAYPNIPHQRIGMGVAAVIATVPPIVFIAIMQFWLRSVWDCTNGILGVLIAVLTG